MTRLGDVADMLVGFAFKSAGFLDAEADGVRILRGDNVQQGYIRWGDKTKKWPTAQCDELERYQLAEDDVILAMDRPIVGDGLKMAWIRPEDLPALLVQRVCRLRGKPGVALTNFIRYVLAAPDFSAHIHRITTGANIPHISGKDIAAYEFELPDLDGQARIVKCLSAYDDLITTNQRRIALLEDAARRLYREWFVHLRFPGHDHSAGKPNGTAAGRPAGVSARDGANQSVPVKDGVPEGWLSLTLGDVCDAVGGGTPSTAQPEYWGGDVTWVTPTDVTRNDCLVLLDSEKKITEAGLANSSAKLVPPETILMTSRASIGFFALMDKPACTNQGFISVLPKQDSARMFLLFNLLNRVEEMIGLATGATFKELSKKTFRALPVLWPTDALLKFYEDKTYPLIQQVRLIKKQNQELTKARDLLLPKFMSGQLDVSGIRLSEEIAA